MVDADRRVRFGQSAAYENISAALGNIPATAHGIAYPSGGNPVDEYRAATAGNYSPVGRMGRASMGGIGIAYTPQSFSVDKYIRAVSRQPPWWTSIMPGVFVSLPCCCWHINHSLQLPYNFDTTSLQLALIDVNLRRGQFKGF